MVIRLPLANLVASLLAVLAISSSVEADTIVLLAGSIDAFAQPADPTAPHPDLVTAFLPAPGNGYLDFDEIPGTSGIPIDTITAHRFELPAGIVGAELQSRVRAGAPGSQTDTIGFYFADGSTSGFPDAAWSRLFGDRAALGTGFLTSSEWTPGMDATFTLDLAALPLDGGGTIDLIPMLNSNGFVDVFVGDESGTDYFQLTLVIPEPSTLPLLSLGLSVLASSRSTRWAGCFKAWQDSTRPSRTTRSRPSSG